MKLRTLLVIAAGLGLHIPAQAARAQAALPPPTDCLLYASWSGRSQARRMTVDTAFSKILAHPQLHRAAQALIGQADALLKDQLGDEQSELFASLKTVCQRLWESPGTFFVQNLDVGEQGLQVELALVVEAGPDAAALHSALLQLAAHLGLAPPIETTRDDGIKLSSFALLPTVVISCSTVGEYCVLTVGTAALDHVARVSKGGTGLPAHNEWDLACQRLDINGQSTLFAGFVNVAGILERIPRIAKMLAGPDSPAANLQMLCAATGLADIQSCAWATIVQDAGFRRAGFLHTSRMDRGLFKLLKPTTIVDDDLAVIPVDANFAAALNFDFAAVREVLLGLLDSAQASEQFRALEAQLNEKLEFNFDQEFLQLLGDTVVLFDAPSTGGVLFSGLTICLEADDAQRVHGCLSRMADLIAAWFEPGMVQVKSYEHGQTDIHYVNVVGFPLPVAPAWAFHGHRLILALYPQMVIDVIDRLEQTDTAGTLLANSDFGRGRILLPAKPMSLCYIDTQRGVGQLYTVLLPVLQSLLGVAQAQGLNLDIACIPPRSAFVDPLFGDVSAVYALEDGLLSVSHGPLPVAVPCLGDPSTLAATLGAGSLVLPKLTRPAEKQRLVSMARLKSIGTACHIFANDHQGHFPDDLQTLVDLGHLTSEIIEPTFIYIPLQDTNCDKQNVLVYERPNDGELEQAVLFLDGHVEVVDPQRCAQLVAETQERLQARP